MGLDYTITAALGVRVHGELQRLGEELQLGRRVAALLSPVIEAMRRCGAGPVRVVDVGCRLDFVVRAMAACSALGPDVELVGVDLNPVLAAGARRLAGLEGLACRFVQGDALRPGVAVREGAARCCGPPSLSSCATLGAALSNGMVVAAAAGLSAIAVLAVEPLAGRLWYTPNASGPAGPAAD